MSEKIIPDKPITFTEPNVSVDELNSYNIKIGNEEYPFYRISIVALSSSGNQVGLLDVLYNFKYIIVQNSSVSDKNKGQTFSVLYKIDDKNFSSESDYINEIKKVVSKLSKPGSSEDYLKSLRATSKIDKELLNYILHESYFMNNTQQQDGSTSGKSRFGINLGQLFVSAIVVGSSIVTLGFYISDWIKRSRMKAIESEASEAQQKIETKIFKNAVVDKSIPVVANLVENIEMFVSRRTGLNGLLVVGSSGVGKTFTVKKVLYDNGYVQGDNYGYIRMTSDKIWDFIYYIFSYRDKPIVVLDDVDTLFDDQLYRQIMLQLLESSPIRVVELPPEVSQTFTKTQSMKVTLEKFRVKSKFIILMNKELKEIPVNIRTRCLIVNYHMNDDTIYKIIRASLKNLYPDIPLEVKEDILFKTYKLMKSTGINLSYRQFDLAVTYYRTFGNEWFNKFEYAVRSK